MSFLPGLVWSGWSVGLPGYSRRRRAWRHLRHFCRSSLSLWWSCFNHYLSATASEDVRNSARGHNKPKKTPPKPTPQESKLLLEIQGICKVFDLERETRQNLQVSYISTVRYLHLGASILRGFRRFVVAARRVMDVLGGKIVVGRFCTFTV